MWGYILRLTYFSIVCLSSVDCAKYDLDAESQKLFGEDLKGALKRFRRSYEYLKILEERQDNMGQEFAESYTYMDAYYIPIMEKKIKEMLGITDDDEKLTDATSAPTPSPSQPDKKLRYKHLRQDESETTKTTKSDVQLLDEYVSDTRVLTVPEINSFVDVGCEYAGKIIQGIVVNLGGTYEEGQDNFSKLSGSGQSGDSHKVSNQDDFVSTVHAAVEAKATEPTETRLRLGSLKKVYNQIISEVE